MGTVWLNDQTIVADHAYLTASFSRLQCMRQSKAAIIGTEYSAYTRVCRDQQLISTSIKLKELIPKLAQCKRIAIRRVLNLQLLKINWFFEENFALYFQVKLTFYGLDALKLTEVREQQDYLWVAPEHIRDHALRPTKEGDLYSFAIVCSEIITKKSAWDLENLDYDLDGML
ncbi:unnamed protein product [Haemonchus placei]|uniref:Nudix hydrolase domain-containing protein n=1 Tax=Haemonchus placei TaxID=6290 RepID=A0A0N4X9Y9_HAEPC|nr:unnamed protein product [Haemonchus placei]